MAHVTLTQTAPMATAEQEDELEALLAIYPDTLVQLERVWGRPCFTVKVKPNGQTEEASVTIKVTFTEKYPKEPPVFQIATSVGLDDKERKAITQLIASTAHAHLGSPLVYTVMQAVEEELVKMHMDGSEYESMLKRQHEERERQEQEKIRKLAAEHQAAMRELELLREQIGEKKMIKQHQDMMSATNASRGPAHSMRPALGPGGVSPRMMPVMPPPAPPDSPIILSRSFKIASSTSRYVSDFEEVDVLGRGGFGEVVKVRNKMDGMFYAVKIIPLEGQDAATNRKIHREVLALARLFHRNIVRYYTAWTEGGQITEDDGEEHAPHTQNVIGDLDLDWLDLTTSQGESPGGQLARPKLVQQKSVSSAEMSMTPDPTTVAPSPRITEQLVEAPDEDGHGFDGDEFDSDSMSGRILHVAHIQDDPDGDDNDEDDDSGSHSSTSSSSSSSSSSDTSSTSGFSTDDESPLPPDPTFDMLGFQSILPQSLHKPAAKQVVPPPVAPAPAAPEPSSSESEDTEGDDTFDETKSAGHHGARLYIQMEYCGGKTLRDAIQQSDRHPPTIWSWFRQILDALAYMHSRGVMHRDVKPANIFLDLEGCIKLGDLGLVADFSGISEEAAHLPTHVNIRHQESVGDAITTGVGTAQYRAPEQAELNARYDQKADMYSLGLVFFEMWHAPFDTYMERSASLNALRAEPARYLNTKDWKAAVPENATTIIVQLLQQDPAKRPTADELLTSDLLPPRSDMDQAYLDEAVRSISAPNSAFYQSLLGCLFDVRRHRLDFGHQFDSPSQVLLRLQDEAGRLNMVRMEDIISKVSRVFRRHGAVEVAPPSVTPPLFPLQLHSAVDQALFWREDDDLPPTMPGETVSLPSHTSAAQVQVLGRDGVLANLPYDLREPFARFVAVFNLDKLKRYHIGRVFRANLKSSEKQVGGQPRELLEADFDIVWDIASESVPYDARPARGLAGGSAGHTLLGVFGIDATGRRAKAAMLEAEVLATTTEVIRSLGPHVGPFMARVNNGRLTHAILASCGIPEAQHWAVSRLLAEEFHRGMHAAMAHPTRPASLNWPKFRSRLIDVGKLAPAVADALKPFCGLPYSLEAALKVLVPAMEARRGAVGDHAAESAFIREAAVAIYELQQLFSSLMAVVGATIDPLRSPEMDATSAGHTSAGAAAGGASAHSAQELVKRAASKALSHICLDLGHIRKHMPLGRPEGFLFQVLVVPTAQPRSSKSTADAEDSDMPANSAAEHLAVADGGRYDDLVLRYRQSGTHMRVPVCVGVRIALEKLAARVLNQVASQHRRQFSEHSVADVLVCAASSDEALRERLKVASLLWTAGINAEYLHEWPVNHDSLHAMCVHRHIPVMVQVKPAALEQGGKLKVRHLASSMSAEVALGDLVKTVKSMIQAPADATPAVVTSTVGSSSAHAPELELILLDNRSTHKPAQMSRQVTGRLTAATLPPSDIPVPVFIVECPFAFMREIGTAFMMHSHDPNAALASITTDNAKFKKVAQLALLRMHETLEGGSLQALDTAGSGKRNAAQPNRRAPKTSTTSRSRSYFVLYSSVDDRHDIVLLK